MSPGSGAPGSGGPGVEELARGVREGDRALLGRAITLVESRRPDHHRRAQELLRLLLPHTGGAHRIGISGVPGVGKSTFIEGFGTHLTGLGHRVAVLAVDPSSSLSGGSILGDKTRMAELAADSRAFIRPSPTGGSLGGVARTTREVILLVEAAGYDTVLVETVGVGQSETLVADMVDVFVTLMLAGAGDELQGIKRGILELVDLVVVNKADGDNRVAAERSRAEYERALGLLRPAGEAGWSPRVVTCSALERRGLDHVRELVGEHRRWAEGGGLLEARRRQQRVHWMWSMVEEEVLSALRDHPEVRDIRPGLEQDVRDGRTTPTAAAEALLAAFGLAETDREGGS